MKRDVETETLAINDSAAGTFLTMNNGAMPEMSGSVM